MGACCGEAQETSKVGVRPRKAPEANLGSKKQDKTKLRRSHSPRHRRQIDNQPVISDARLIEFKNYLEKVIMVLPSPFLGGTLAAIDS